MKSVALGLASALLWALAGCSSSSNLQGQGSGPGGSCSSCKGHGGVAGASSGGSKGSSGSSSSGGVGGSSGGTTGGGSTSTATSTATSTSTASGGSGGTSGAVCLPQPQPFDGGCWSSEPAGGPCVTLADCAAGLMCNYANNCETGSCAPQGSAPTMACSANGQPCGPGQLACCGGVCRAGVCAAWTPCGESGVGCQSDLDCCNDFSCQGGSCQGSCTQIFGACQGRADCCYQEGLDCVLVEGFGTTAICYPGNPDQPRTANGDAIPCGAPCSGWECQQGAACQVVGGVDPCAAAGLVCDGTYSVCRNPEAAYPPAFNTEPCQPYGEPCLPIPGSNAQPICSNGVAVSGVAGYYCVQACDTTADCVNPIATCLADPSVGGSFCAQWDQCFSSQFFGACDAAGTNDGFCYPLDYGSGPGGRCIQATLDGGAANDRCLADFNDNRQNGGLCDTQDLCNFQGLCEPACNAGTSGTPGCDAGQRCQNLWDVYGQPLETGYCTPVCDFTDPDGGGCPLDSTGVQEACFPELFVDQTDEPTGVCVAGSATPIAVGQVCPDSIDGQIGSVAAPCVPGAACLGLSALSTLRTCVQLCDRVGQSGGCPVGQLCHAAIIEGFAGNPTHTGYCQ